MPGSWHQKQKWEALQAVRYRRCLISHCLWSPRGVGTRAWAGDPRCLHLYPGSSAKHVTLASSFASWNLSFPI